MKYLVNKISKKYRLSRTGTESCMDEISCQQNFFIDRLRYNIIKSIITKLILINKIYASFLSITPIIFKVG